jgi:hypothetical protein
MAKVKLSLQPSEGIVAQSASNIYAAYIMAGQSSKGTSRTCSSLRLPTLRPLYWLTRASP